MIPTHAYRRPAPTGLGFAYNITTSIAPSRGLAFGVYTSFGRVLPGLAGWRDGRLMELADIDHGLIRCMHLFIYLPCWITTVRRRHWGSVFLKTLAAGICFSCSKRLFVSRFSKESLGSQYCGLPQSTLMSGNDEGVYYVGWDESQRIVGRSIFFKRDETA